MRRLTDKRNRKVKHLLRSLACRTQRELWRSMQSALDAVTSTDAENCFWHAPVEGTMREAKITEESHAAAKQSVTDYGLGIGNTFPDVFGGMGRAGHEKARSGKVQRP